MISNLDISENNTTFEEAKRYFNKYSNANPGQLSEREFYLFTKDYLSYSLNNQDLAKTLEDERFFNVHLGKGEERMTFDEFLNAYTELNILLNAPNPDDAELEMKFDLEHV